MNGPIRQLAIGVFVAFSLLITTVTYWQVVVADTYRDDERNVRVAAGRVGRERGVIITADGVVVAQSITDPDDPRVFRRSYPEADRYGHLVGYATILFGSAGLERSRTAELVSDRDATLSGVLRALFGGDFRPMGLGLTIEDRLQQAAADALGGQRGAVIAIDPETGAVLAMVSQPGFDPNTLVGTAAGAAGAALEADPAQPLLNRAIFQTYAPGSTFKIVTATAGLESGLAGPATLFANPTELALPGSTATIRNYSRRTCGSADMVTLAEAFVRSCNTIFGDLGLQLGAEPLVAAAEAAGFNEEIPFDLLTLASVIPAADTFENDLPGVAQSAIGQRDVRATPLQLALLAAAVANEGVIMQPYLVARVFNADGTVEATTEPVEWRRAMSPSTAAVLVELMERVVTAGTGTRAAVPGIRVGGKTGTAEIPDAPPHAWFVGFGPVGAELGIPRIVVAVVVESGGDAGEDASGGTIAAPIAQAVMAEFFGVAGG